MQVGNVDQVPRRVLLLAALAALAVKAVALFVVLPGLTGLPLNAANFPDGYDLLASNLLTGNGYRMFADTSPTMIRTPGYVVVLAGIFAAFGKGLLPVQLANVAFSALAAILVFDVARRVLRSEWAGVIAALIVFLHPGTIVADSRAGVESLLLLAMSLCLWLCVRAVKGGRLLDYVWLGIAFGSMLLIKSSGALILPGAAAWTVWKLRRERGPQRRRALVGFAVALAVAGLCLTPWIARNYVISGKFVPTQTAGSVSFFQGQYVVKNMPSPKDHAVLLEEAADRQVDLARQMGLRSVGYFFQQFYSVADEMAFYSELSRQTWKEYARSPLLIFKAAAYNLIAFWVQGRTWSATAANAIIALPLLLLVAMGIRSAERQGYDVSLLVVFVACFLLPHLLIIAIARFYVPLLPPLAVLAAVPLASVATRSVRA
jgi:4-amino-4-deoxy-L-arabinose transferase-like glycosyltransferase